jgi:hypothetical protein
MVVKSMLEVAASISSMSDKFYSASANIPLKVIKPVIKLIIFFKQ